MTASAGPRTRDDIAALLFPHPPEVFLRSFARENLALAFRERRDGLRQLADFVERHAGSSGIVYCNSRRKVDVLARDLRGFGFDALPYHAGQGGEERSAHQDAFFAREGVVMVATIAFGMGVDKANVRFVAHADPPDSVEGYYQEIGRAGRDGLPANTLLLFDRRELARRWRPPAALANDPVALAEFLAPAGDGAALRRAGLPLEGFARGVWRNRRGLRQLRSLPRSLRRAAPRQGFFNGPASRRAELDDGPLG